MKRKQTASPLSKLRRRLTLLSACLTGAVLVVMAAAALTIAADQLRRSGLTAFQSNINAIVAKLQNDRVLSSTWLAQTEAADGLVISISDAGVPLRFSGAWTPATERDVLLARAREGGLQRGVDAGSRPLSVIGTTATAPFQVRGDQGERYLAAVVLIPAHGSYQSLVLLRDMSGADRQAVVLTASFAALVVLGVAALLGLCWLFAGRAIAPIEENQRRQTEFVAAASHELRSPLAVIRTSASALGPDAGQNARLQETIDRECVRMARLVDDLLTLAGRDSGSWSIQPAGVDLDTLLLETCEGFYPVAAQKGQSLRLDVPDDPLPPVNGDEQRLRQILTVLLDNACSYAPRGGHVVLSGAAEGRRVLLRVSDDGPGIPAQHLPHIFDRFYRADPARGGKEHFGLGLSIARELAALHGGSLTVEHTGPSGSTFLLKLPVQAVER